MRNMQLNHIYFSTYAFWMQVLVLPQWTQGLTCFNCNSKTDQGCKNDELKSGHKNNKFSEKCIGSDAVCVKEIALVQNYYQEHYNRNDMKHYYKAMDKAAECRGTGMSSGPGVTNAPGGKGTTTGSKAGHPGGTDAAGSGAGDSQGSGAGDSQGAGAGVSQAGDAGVAGTTLEAAAVTEAAADAGDGTRRRRAVAEKCPAFPKEFPEPVGVVPRNEQRWVYSCGNRSHWKDNDDVPLSMEQCHSHNDGVVSHTVCLCAGDLCNGATVRVAVPFLVLSAALMHLQGVIG